MKRKYLNFFTAAVSGLLLICLLLSGISAAAADVPTISGTRPRPTPPEPRPEPEPVPPHPQYPGYEPTPSSTVTTSPSTTKATTGSKDPTTDSPDDDDPEKKAGLPVGALIGIIAGGVVLVLLIAYIVTFFIWRKLRFEFSFLTRSFEWLNWKLFKSL